MNTRPINIINTGVVGEKRQEYDGRVVTFLYWLNERLVDHRKKVEIYLQDHLYARTDVNTGLDWCN